MKNLILLAATFGVLTMLMSDRAFACNQSSAGRYAKTTPTVAQKAIIEIKTSSGKSK